MWCRNLLLGSTIFNQAHLVKIEWLVTNVTAVGSPGRAERAICGVVFATPPPSSRTPIDRSRRRGPVGIATSFGYLRATTISTDRTSGESIDFVLFCHPVGIISARSGGGTNPQLSSRTLPYSPLHGRSGHTMAAFGAVPPFTKLMTCWTTYAP